MNRPLLAACALTALTATPAAAEPCSRWGAGVEVGRVERGDLNEASGLARAWSDDDALWSHNDSGDSPRLFAVGADGRDLGTWRVTGADARDWEDITRGPCGDRTCLFIADFGNNSEAREDLAIYRVPEPARPDGPLAEPGDTEPATRFDLTYDLDDGANPDAESLWYDARDGALYMATKEERRARVLRVTLDEASGRAELELVGEIALARATAGAASPDGDQFVIRNYFAAFAFSRAGGESVADALATGGVQVRLLNEGQAEAIAYDEAGDALWTVSEDDNPPLLRYPCADPVDSGAEDAGGQPDAGGAGDAGAPPDAGAGGGSGDAGRAAPDASSPPGSGSGAGTGGCASAPLGAPAAPVGLGLGVALMCGLGRRRS